ncbi:histidine--tRNA ligase [Candidatus Kaiserbacteria bacterium RIFCSPHIGHO2_01_FULL_53_31]|uniref:Histidine--tRNA ligase n=1 Tax=Candidatus Kaiserbacteria bacterium RIFCSPHIGHO2_01_FULL_53_31 TaxID=1798481 RepID=A0A1F6CHC4_9BACT|nr:MAG: histidine--tRNA ligase [Candidatus Kaiserbacteria bacterium RIFCSPHIGHO2_01_FULL_53_31]
MSEPLSTEPYKGVRDFYPTDWARLQTIFTRIRETLALWGYEEYNASPLERAELYGAKTSEEIVSEQTYTFTDRGDRRVTLRPEMTPTLARMVAAKRREMPFPLRWFSIPNIFRYERPQKGRLREHYQLNVDLVGIASSEVDIEIVKIASEIVRAFGAKESDFTIRVNSRALLTAACTAALLDADATRAYLHLLDKKSKMPAEEFNAAREAITTTDPLPLIDSTEIESFVATLKEHGIGNAVFDSTLTRGFDYYTGVVFEIFDTDPANPRSIFGGGRFDKLVALFGGDPIPAVGFGMGDVTFADFLETHGLTPSEAGKRPQLYIGTPNLSNIPAAQAFADMLRAQGVRVFVNLSERALGDQIKDAVKRNIPLFIAYGADEVASGTVKLKTLAMSEEISIPMSELASKIQSSN